MKHPSAQQVRDYARDHKLYRVVLFRPSCFDLIEDLYTIENITETSATVNGMLVQFDHWLLEDKQNNLSTVESLT